jgi:hypothetical protein
VVDDRAGALRHRPVRVGREDPSVDLVAGDVGEPKVVAEGHTPARRLHVAEADADGDDVQQCVAGAELGFGNLDELERLLVVDDCHRPHGAPPRSSRVVPAVAAYI